MLIAVHGSAKDGIFLTQNLTPSFNCDILFNCRGRVRLQPVKRSDLLKEVFVEVVGTFLNDD